MDRIKHYLKAARRMSPRALAGAIFKKIFSRLGDELQFRKAIKRGTGISDRIFLGKLGIKSRAFLSQSPKMEKKTDIIVQILDKSFLDAVFDKSDAEAIMNCLGCEEKQDILEAAEKIINHEFNLLGSGRSKVSYDFEAEGFNGNKYSSRITSFDKESGRERIAKKAEKLISEKSDCQYPEYFVKYQPIDWHIDFKSGYRWNEKTWYKKISYGKDAGVDVKVPWELSRLQHLVALGQAYVISDDQKYVYEYMVQVIDWIESNPPQFGVNWKCTMDVAIRAANLAASLAFFIDSETITGKFIFYLAKSIYLHGCHILANLEYGSITSNHYLSDIAGLFFAGEFFGKSRIGEKWQKFCIKEFIREMKKQVYPDGADFEASSCYHRLVLEMFFYPVVCLVKKAAGARNSVNLMDETGIRMENSSGPDFTRIAGKIFGGDFMESLFKMFEFILYLRKPGGGMWPQIGDNDNGRLFIFSMKDVLDFSYLLHCGSIFFKEESFTMEDHKPCSEALWLFGRAGYDWWDTMSFKNYKEYIIENNTQEKDPGEKNSRGKNFRGKGSRAFKYAGIYIMRDKHNYLAVSCGPNGQNGNGGHCHNDKLSFELVCEGHEIIVDPGTYIYTPSPEIRNLFRSTGFHSTVRVDGHEQNRFKKENLFSLEDDSRAEAVKWLSTDDSDYLAGRHYGYNRLENPVTHRREIFFSKNPAYWVIRDYLTGCGDHLLEFNFHFLYDFEVIEEQASARLRLGEERYFWVIPFDPHKLGSTGVKPADIKPAGLTDPGLSINPGMENLKISKAAASFSAEYGIKKDSHMLRFTAKAAVPFEILFLLMPSGYKTDAYNKAAAYIERYEDISQRK